MAKILHHYFPMRSILLTILIILCCSNYASAMTCSEIFSVRAEISPKIQAVLSQFEFPIEADVQISNVNLRRAIFEAFGEKDFYTNQPIKFEDMRIDHIIPSSRGGPDNIFNYVPTTSRHNGKKWAKFDEVSAIAMLSIVRTAYANDVLTRYQVLSRRPNQPLGVPKRIEEVELSSYIGSDLSITLIRQAYPRQAAQHDAALSNLILKLKEQLRTSPDQISFEISIGDLTLPRSQTYRTVESLNMLNERVVSTRQIQTEEGHRISVGELSPDLSILFRGETVRSEYRNVDRQEIVTIIISPLLRTLIVDGRAELFVQRSIFSIETSVQDYLDGNY